MSDKLIIMDEYEQYAWITFNRPEKLNAMSSPMVQEFQEAIEKCRNRYPVVVVTGTGKAFCVGVDMKERNAWVINGAKIRGDSVRNKWYDTIGTIIRNHPSIFIAAVNGLCLGGGTTLINICDLAIAAEEAEISIPQINFGIYPGVAGAASQTRLLRKRASWLILTGKRIDGKTAEEWGLVNFATPKEKLMNEARALAAHIAQYNPVTLDWCKKALDQIPSQISDWTEALYYGQSINSVIQSQIGKSKMTPEKFNR